MTFAHGDAVTIVDPRHFLAGCHGVLLRPYVAGDEPKRWWVWVEHRPGRANESYVGNVVQSGLRPACEERN